MQDLNNAPFQKIELELHPILTNKQTLKTSYQWF